jgi:hypothetical protein
VKINSKMALNQQAARSLLVQNLPENVTAL